MKKIKRVPNKMSKNERWIAISLNVFLASKWLCIYDFWDPIPSRKIKLLMQMNIYFEFPKSFSVLTRLSSSGSESPDSNATGQN